MAVVVLWQRNETTKSIICLPNSKH